MASDLLYAHAASALISAGATLTLTNWNGLPDGGGADQIYFGTDLSSIKLAQIKFLNPAGFAPGLYDAKQLASFEIVPVVPIPEPGSMVTGGALLLFLLWRERRRLQSWWKRAGVLRGF